MLPYFNASGNNLYAKCAHLYFQEMRELSKPISSKDFKLFSEKSYFTIRRTDQAWCGTWTDMTIEQYLMRSIKTAGGLSHGRGISDNTLLRWTLCTPVCAKINQCFEKFAGTNITFKHFHEELGRSRQKRDHFDHNKFIEWFYQHNPFLVRNANLVSIFTGLPSVASSQVNCHDAKRVGEDMMNKFFGKNFGDLIIPRKDRAITLAESASVKIGDENVNINPQQVFHRLICVLNEKN